MLSALNSEILRELLQFIATKLHAAQSVTMLKCLYLEAGYSISRATARAAASHSRTDRPVLRWLWQHGVHWNFLDLDAETIYDRVWFLTWPHDQQGARYDTDTMMNMLHVCGRRGYTECAAWLIAHGAEFPTVLAEYNDETEEWTPWRDEMVALARQHGCTAPELTETENETDDDDADLEVELLAED